MSLLDRLKKMSGIGEETPLDDSAAKLYSQLQNNRTLLLSKKVIPKEMGDEFVKTIYPDHNLRWYAQELCQDSQLGTGIRTEFILNHMRLSLSINRFGRRLIMHGIHPEDILSGMLQGL